MITSSDYKIGKEPLNIPLDIHSGEELYRAEIIIKSIGREPFDIIPALPENSIELSTKVLPKQKGKWQWSAADEGISWIMCQFGARQSVSSIKITLPEESSDMGRPVHLKILSGTHWYPPIPHDNLKLGELSRMPGLLAEGLMLEIMENKGGMTVPGNAVIAGLEVEVMNQPADLEAGIEDGPPFFSYPGILPSHESIHLHGLKEAVNSYRQIHGMTGEITLYLRSAIGGEISFYVESWETSRIIDRFNNGNAGKTLSVPWEGGEIGRITIGGDAAVRSCEMRVIADSVPEELIAKPERLNTKQAQLCDAAHKTAQRIPPLAGNNPLAGIDLYMQPLSGKSSGALTLYPEKDAQPSPAPFANCEIPFEWCMEAPLSIESPQWFSFQLPSPVLPPKDPWWAVLEVTAGELIWFVDGADEHADEHNRYGALYQYKNGPWLPVMGKGAPKAGLYRLRTALEGISLKPLIAISRGAISITVHPDEQNRIMLSEEEIRGLNKAVSNHIPENNEALHYDQIVFSEKSGHAGILTVKDLRLLCEARAWP